MRARPDAVADGMGRLAGVARGADSFAYDAINIGHRRAVAHASDRIVEDFQQLIQKLVIPRRQVARANIFR
jgi:hypothetical protein